MLVADLPAKYLAQVLEHDQQCPATPAILFAYGGYQRVGDPGVVLFGLHLTVQLRPQRLVFKDLLQYSAHADQEVGEGQRPIRFLRKADDHDSCCKRRVRLNGVLDAREQVGLANSARADEQQMVL